MFLKLFSGQKQVAIAHPEHFLIKCKLKEGTTSINLQSSY